MGFWILLIACQDGDPQKESQEVDHGKDSGTDSESPPDDSDS